MTPNTEKVTAIVQNNPFMQFLAQLHGGLTVTELTEAQRAVVEAVRKTGKKGSIKLEIVISPDGKGEVMSIESTAKVKPEIPKKAVRPTVFFVAEDNSLTRDDPRQREMEFQRPPGVAAAGK